METERLGCTEISIPFYLWVIFQPLLNIQGNRRGNMLIMKSQDGPFSYNNVSSTINLSLSYIHTMPQQQKYGHHPCPISILGLSNKNMVSVVYEYYPIYILLTLRNAGIFPQCIQFRIREFFPYSRTVHECKIKMETGKMEHLQNKQLKK